MIKMQQCHDEFRNILIQVAFSSQKDSTDFIFLNLQLVKFKSGYVIWLSGDV